MEDVLDLYAEPYDPKRPVVCFDETSKQLVAEKRAPIPAKAGRQERFDYEYQRNGTRNLFMTCEPLAGWRHVAVTGRRTMEDFAHQMRWLSDAAYPEAEKVRVVLDNPVSSTGQALNTHRPASLYEAFEPKEARRVIQRLEFHYTPKHSSWLNMAEIEFSVFSNQCLNRRIEDEVSLKREIAALETERNQAGATIDWRFTITDARNKLPHIYPSLEAIAHLMLHDGILCREQLLQILDQHFPKGTEGDELRQVIEQVGKLVQIWSILRTIENITDMLEYIEQKLITVAGSGRTTSYASEESQSYQRFLEGCPPSPKC